MGEPGGRGCADYEDEGRADALGAQGRARGRSGYGRGGGGDAAWSRPGRHRDAGCDAERGGDGGGGVSQPRGGAATRGYAQGQRGGNRRGGSRQGLPQWRGDGAGEELRSAYLHSGKETSGAAPLGGQNRGATGGVPESAAGAWRLRQKLIAAARRTGGTQLCTLLRDGRHEAHPSARTLEHSEAATGPCGGLQLEPDLAQSTGCGHAAAVEGPGGNAFFAVYLLLTRQKNRNRLTRSRISISCTKSVTESRSSTRSSARLVVPTISYLCPGLLGVSKESPG